MFQHKTGLPILLLFSIFILFGCAAEETNTAQITAVPSATQLAPPVTSPEQPTFTAVSTLPPINTATPAPTLSPEPSSTPTTLPISPTPRPTLVPTATPTLELIELLTERYPSIEALEVYLLGIPDGYFQTTYPISQDYLIDEFRYRGLTDGVELIYQDVNGDDVEDLIVSDVFTVAILLWLDESYSAPFILVGSTLKYAPSSKVTLEDWTNDDIPEIIFDYRGDSGGTGIRFYYWYRFIITCTETNCHIAWAPQVTHLTDDGNFGGMTLIRSTFEIEADEQDGVFVEQKWEGFSVYDSDFTPQFWALEGAYSPSEYLKVFTTTVSIYTWNGNTFEFVKDEDIADAYEIAEDANLIASNATDTASVTYESNHSLGQLNDVCQLVVNKKSVGKLFGCKGNFTSVEWTDIVGSEAPEIVVRTLSAPQPYDRDYNLMADIWCVHQRYIIYQWDGENAVEIANIAGCVVQSDLYGVKMLDFDGDSQVEIVAASSWFTERDCYPEPSYSCWYEFGYTNQVYKWNGSEFVFWLETEDDID